MDAGVQVVKHQVRYFQSVLMETEIPHKIPTMKSEIEGCHGCKTLITWMP